MKAVVGTFNQEKALVGAFSVSVIVQIHRLIVDSTMCAGICMEYVPSYLPSLTLYDFLCQAPEEPPNIRNFLPAQNSAGSWLRHIYPLFDVGFNVSTVLQHDVVWVQMFIM